MNNRSEMEGQTKNGDIIILYIHGMGGGGDSRIPSILKGSLPDSLPEGFRGRVRVVVRTYDFDPETGRAQIASWVDELRPVLVIGESLGSLQALRIRNVPRIFVSPSLNAPIYLGYLSFLTLIPGVTPLLDRIYLPKPGDRQRLHFTFRTLYRYIGHRKAALRPYRQGKGEGRGAGPSIGGMERNFAFFGLHDHYRRSGIVSIRTWKKYFGENSWETYPGTHFMEEEYVLSMLVPRIISVLGPLFLQARV